MRLVFLRVLSVLFSFVLFEVAYCLFLFDYNWFPSSEWLDALIHVGLPVIAVSQLSLWSIWGGMGSQAMHRRVFGATSILVAALLVPVAVGRHVLGGWTPIYWEIAIAVALAFSSCVLCSLIFGKVFHRRLVVLNETGVASFVVKSQFGFRFMFAVMIAVAIFSLLLLVIEPNNVTVEFTSAVGGLVFGLFCVAQAIAFIWILLRPTPIRWTTFICLAGVIIVLMSLHAALIFGGSWANSVSLSTSDILVNMAIGAGFSLSSVVSTSMMRYLDFRLVHTNQLNLVVQNPPAVPKNIARSFRKAIWTMIVQVRRPWVAGAILAFMGWLAYDWFLFDGRIRVSKETTYATAPVRSDGMVDFCSAINQHLGAGVKPEDNAVVDLLQVFGPQAVPKECDKEFYRWLRIAPLPDGGNYLVQYQDLPEAIAAAGDERPRIPPIFGKLWTESEFPAVVAWINTNRQQIEAVRIASRKAAFFSPFLLRDGERPIDSVRELDVCLRETAKLLGANAMHELQRGNWRTAMEDIATIGRLGQLIMRQGSMSNWMHGISLLRNKHHLQQVLVEHIESNDLADFVQMSDQLRLQPISSCFGACGYAERLMFLESVVNVKQTEFRLVGFNRFREPSTVTIRLCRSSDWNEVLRVCNDSWNEIEAATKTTDRDDRFTHLRAWTLGLESFDKSLYSSLAPHSLWTRKARGHGIATILIGSLALDWFGCEVRLFTMESLCDLNEISFALEAFRAARGQYPSKLNELSPTYLPAIPADRFTDKPYFYQIKLGGYLLYGVGQDCRDDGGDTANDLAVQINREKKN